MERATLQIVLANKVAQYNNNISRHATNEFWPALWFSGYAIDRTLQKSTKVERWKKM
jgi:hypothetical protein